MLLGAAAGIWLEGALCHENSKFVVSFKFEDLRLVVDQVINTGEARR
jgi:hypothetical protein